MSIKEAYNNWAASYDQMENKTRDLEKIAAKKTLENLSYSNVVEIGCGTGKNTIWIAEKADQLIGLDFSNEMLTKAKQKFQSSNVDFIETDITRPWKVEDNWADLITCSLTLEHIEDLHFVFNEAAKKLIPGGHFFVCELHPFRQYKGSQAKFEQGGKERKLDVFLHHLSDYTTAASKNNLKLIKMEEWFDDANREALPRLISFVFQK